MKTGIDKQLVRGASRASQIVQQSVNACCKGVQETVVIEAIEVLGSGQAGRSRSGLGKCYGRWLCM